MPELLQDYEWESPLTPMAEDFLATKLTRGAVPTSATASETTAIVMTVEGATQGKFVGDLPENRISASLVSYSLVSPRDVATGRASGRRQHAPFVIRQATGASSLQFFKALIENEVLRTVVINFGRATAAGVAVPLKITLAAATVAGWRILPDGALGSVEVCLSFGQITIDHAASAVSVTDQQLANA